MIDYLISKRLKELCGDGQSLNNEGNKLLFNEYARDKLNNVPLEESNARTLLILGNNRIISFVLRKEFHVFGNYDNLEEFSVGKIGLVNAVDTYNHESEIKFVTYAYRVIAHEIQKYYSKRNSLSNRIEQNKISLNSCLLNDNNEETAFSMEGVLIDDDNFIEKVADSDMVNAIMRNLKYLTQREAFTIIHYLGLMGNEPLTQGEISQIIHTLQCNVSIHFTKGIQKLRVLTLDECVLNEQDLKLKERLIKQGPQNDLLNENWRAINISKIYNK